MKTFTDNLVVPKTKPRNFEAKYAQKSGAGSHELKKYSRKVKHKNKNFLSEDYCDQDKLCI